MPLDEELLKILACPACKGELKYERGSGPGKEEHLDCPACAKRYPVKDGIPVMLIEEAVPISSDR